MDIQTWTVPQVNLVNKNKDQRRSSEKKENNEIHAGIFIPRKLLHSFANILSILEITQDFIPPHRSFTYQFKAEQAGTFWYHSHNLYQVGDGLFGAFIINKKNDRLKR